MGRDPRSKRQYSIQQQLSGHEWTSHIRAQPGIEDWNLLVARSNHVQWEHRQSWTRSAGRGNLRILGHGLSEIRLVFLYSGVVRKLQEHRTENVQRDRSRRASDGVQDFHLWRC